MNLEVATIQWVVTVEFTLPEPSVKLNFPTSHADEVFLILDYPVGLYRYKAMIYKGIVKTHLSVN